MTVIHCDDPDQPREGRSPVCHNIKQKFASEIKDFDAHQYGCKTLDIS